MMNVVIGILLFLNACSLVLMGFWMREAHAWKDIAVEWRECAWKALGKEMPPL